MILFFFTISKSVVKFFNFIYNLIYKSYMYDTITTVLNVTNVKLILVMLVCQIVFDN